jgi:L-ascorbate metabolism protein UlaG (beta-lactamase superfamily)
MSATSSRSTKRLKALFVCAFVLAACAASAGDLRATFIGNAGIHVTDGKDAILIDFPYESGAFGYMKWSKGAVPAGPRPLCLFTHAHADHYARDLVARFCGTVTGPADVIRDSSVPALPLAAPTRWRSIVIHPLATAHGMTEHYSYLIEWNGQRIYVSGDTTDTGTLFSSRDLDLAFVTPWHWRLVTLATNARVDARRVVIHHHMPEETIAGDGRIVPKQGEVIVSAASAAVPRADERRDDVPIAASGVEPLPVAFAEADRNGKTADGRAYQNVFFEQFSRVLPNAFPQCAGQGVQITKFDMALQLDEKGAVLGTAVRPRSPFSQCMAKAIARERFPPPPRDAYWVPASFN